MYDSNRSLDQFRWLSEDNPAGRAILFIALLNDKVVGMQSLIPYEFIRNGKLIQTYKSEDTLVEKSLRGKGIFSILYKMLHDRSGDYLVWGLTDKKEILERVNMPSSERLTIAISVRKPSLISDSKGIHRFVAKTLFYSYLYFKSSFRSKKGNTSLLTKEIHPSSYGNSKLISFFEKLSLQNPDLYYPRMTKEYMKWRLVDNPNLDHYKVVASYDADGAIAICSIIGFEGKSAYWQSFYAIPDLAEEEKIGHIVNLKEKFFQSEVKLIHTWLFDCNASVKEVKDIFYKAGFSKVRDGLWIVHNSTDKEIDVHDLYFSPQLGIR